MSLYPHRKYARYPLIRRRRRYLWRLNHDAWAVAFVVALLLVFLALDLVRGIQW